MAVTKIVRSRDCGNSPKNQLIEDLSIALSTGDRGIVGACVADDVEWRVVGEEVVRGRDALQQALAHVKAKTLVKLEVSHVVSHGRAGAVNGTLDHRGTTTEFCDVFEFANTKGTSIGRITSYRVDVRVPPMKA